MGNEYGGQNDLPGEYREEQDREDEPTDIRVRTRRFQFSLVSQASFRVWVFRRISKTYLKTI